MKVRVLVSFKDNILDPQGQTVKNTLQTLGYDFINDLRQGKVFEIDMKELPPGKVEEVIHEIATKVLTNPIIEKFSYEIIG